MKIQSGRPTSALVRIPDSSRKTSLEGGPAAFDGWHGLDEKTGGTPPLQDHGRK